MDNIPLELLAVVEVDESDAVACLAAGCNHRVFRAIHVVRDDGVVNILGSTCFRKLYGTSTIAKARPRFSDVSGRRLSEQERVLLRENAEALVYAFEIASSYAPKGVPDAVPRSSKKRRRGFTFEDPLSGIDPVIIAEARRNVTLRFGCDGDQPGWNALVMEEVRKLLVRNDG